VIVDAIAIDASVDPFAELRARGSVAGADVIEQRIALP